MKIQKIDKFTLYSYIVIHVRNLVRQVHTDDTQAWTITKYMPVEQARILKLKGIETPTCILSKDEISA